MDEPVSDRPAGGAAPGAPQILAWFAALRDDDAGKLAALETRAAAPRDVEALLATLATGEVGRLTGIATSAGLSPMGEGVVT